MAKLYPIMQKHAIEESIHSINLHYVNGKIEVELVLNTAHHAGVLSALKSDCEAFEEIRSVSIFIRT